MAGSGRSRLILVAWSLALASVLALACLAPARADEVEVAGDVAVEGTVEAVSDEESGPEAVSDEDANAQSNDLDVEIQDGEIIDSGTWGTCPWTLSDDGTLTIGAGTGADTGGEGPWYGSRTWIKSVVTDGTVRLPTDCSALFSGCIELGGVDASGWDTSHVTDMTNTFNSCWLLSALDVSGWDTSSVTSMRCMFCGCKNLHSLDVSRWDTSSVADMRAMFMECRFISSLDVSGWDTSSVTDMRDMFDQCRSLKALDVSGWDVSSVTSMYDMFGYCSSLTSLDVSGWDTSRVVSMYNMFSYCESLASLDVSRWDTSSVADMRGMFNGCKSLASVDVSGWDTSSVTSMSYMFDGCESLASVDVSGWDTSGVTSMYGMFQDCKSLASLDVSGWDTSSVADMRDMFYDSRSLASLDASGWDTSSVARMDRMFYDCRSLTSLGASGWDTSSVWNMDCMFYDCRSLATLVVGNGWSTSKLSYNSYMFYGCEGLVGECGTAYSADHTDYTYAHVDEPGNPGYLTSSGYMLRKKVTSVELVPAEGFGEGAYPYEGASVTPALVVRAGDDVLGASDYIAVYSGNDAVGEASVKVTGVGGYRGSVTKEFAIVASNDISAAKVELTPTFKDEKGRTCRNAKGGRPMLGPVILAGRTLREGTDFTVEYATPEGYGKGTYTLTGKGDYVGTKELEWYAVPETVAWHSQGENTTGSRNPGQIKAYWQGQEGVDGYEVSLQLEKGKEVEGYPLRVEERDAPTGGAWSTVLPDALRDGATYAVRVRAYVTVDGETLAGQWNDQTPVEVMSAEMSLDSPRDRFGGDVPVVPTLGRVGITLTFGEDDIRYTGRGRISVHDDTAGRDVASLIPPADSASATSEFNARDNVESFLNGLLFSLNERDVPELTQDLGANDPDVLFTNDHTYSIVVEPGTIAYPSGGEWGGAVAGRFKFKTISYQLPRYRNTAFDAERVGRPLAEQIYSPSEVDNIVKKSNLGGGVCTGMCLATMAWDAGKANVRKIGSGKDNLGNLSAGAEDGTGTTLRDYIIKAQLYSMSADVTVQKEKNANDLEALYGRARSGGVCVSVGSGGRGHQLVALGVRPGDAYDAIVVYDCNVDSGESLGEVRLAKGAGGHTGWVYGDEYGSDKSGNRISWFAIPDGTDDLVVRNPQNLVYSNKKVATHFAGADLTQIRQANGEDDGEDSGYLYWTEGSRLTLRAEDQGGTEPLTVSLSDGTHLYEATVGPADSCTFDLQTGTVTYHPSDSVAHGRVALSVTTWEGYGTSERVCVEASGGEGMVVARTDEGVELAGADPGEATVTVTSSEGGAEASDQKVVASPTGDLLVRAGKGSGGAPDLFVATTSLRGAEVSVPDQTYTGKALKPAVAVTLGGKSLVAGADYDASYSGNTDAGTATVTVTGKGGYFGTKSATFRIAPASLSGAGVSVPAQTYTGKVIAPAAKVSLGGRTLRAGADYTVAYANNVNAGTATVTVTGKGNYAGAKKASFAIAKAANGLTVKAKTATLKASKLARKKQTVAAKKAYAVSKANGKVTYKLSSVSKKKFKRYFKVNAKTGKVTVRKGLGKGTYKLKVKVSAAGDANHEAAAKTVTVNVKVK